MAFGGGKSMSFKKLAKNVAMFTSFRPDSRAASIAASVGGSQDGAKRQKFVIWPEWSDADVNAERWDVAHKGKEKDKGKSPVVPGQVQHFFEDPDGKVIVPNSLKVTHWKRPQDFILEKVPTVVDPDGMNGFDLLSANEHIHDSELIRWVISQIDALWKLCKVKVANPDPADPTIQPDGTQYTWKPWEHIYAITKVGKGPTVPQYNPHGKYVVRLYWMGCWRKIIVDDMIPFDDNDQMLLPATSLQHELWPMLLTKALIKIASLDYNGGSSSCEFGDFSVIHCLTGWLPEIIPLQTLYFADKERQATEKKNANSDASEKQLRYGHMEEVWNWLKGALPEWKLPEPEPEKPVEGDPEKEGTALDVKDEKSDKDPKETARGEKPAKDGGGKKEDGKGKDKDKGKDKGKDKDKDKNKEKTSMDDGVLPENPEIVVFASYTSLPKYPVRVSVLAEMADASERLRQTGLSHMYPHPVLITQTRACPLEPPPPPEVVPSWKLIRPKKKKVMPTDEPKEPEVEKPIQCVEVTSPFVNYKVSPVPIPTDVHRPKSSLERGGSRPGTANQEPIEETDENAPEPELEPLKPESPPVEEKKRRKSRHQFSPAENSENPTPSPKPTTPVRDKTGKERKKSAGSALARKESSLKDQPLDSTASPKMAKKNSTIKREASAKSIERPGSVKSAKLDAKLTASVVAVHDAKASIADKLLASIGSLTPADAPLEGSLGSELGELDAEKPMDGEEPVEDDAEEKPKDVWMDFEAFCKCFKTLYVYHKTNTYPCNQKHSDLKKMERVNYYSLSQGVSSGAGSSGGGGKKSAPNTAASSGLDDRAPLYLFVDNLKATEIVVSYSSLSRWNEPPAPPIIEKVSHDKLKVKGEKSDLDKEMSTLGTGSVMGDADDTQSHKDGSTNREFPPISPGTLIAEPHSWKSLVTGQPILRIRSTATRAAVLSLPAGRHVLKFSMTSPLGHHVHLCSSVQFVFGDEEAVMPHLTKESCRFVDNATQVLSNVGKCISVFNDHAAFTQAWEELLNSHCPYRNNKLISKHQHFAVFNDALYSTLKKSLTDSLNPEMAYAWKVFNNDLTTRNPLGLPYGSSRPESQPTGPSSSSHATGATSHRGSAKPGKKPAASASTTQQDLKQQQQQPGEEKVAENWVNREPTAEEHVAAVKIQKCYKGHFVRKAYRSRHSGTEENLRVQEILQRAWAIMEPNVEQYGLQLFRTMFKSDPEMMSYFPFHKDEWNKISYSDYNGVYPEQPPNTWFVVFREIFYVTEETLVVPKLYVPIPTCMLRVINNDTSEEIPRVFQKVAPYVYKKNKLGYTFVAEARTSDLPLPNGKWRMRLIGSLSPLPAPLKNDVTSSFHMREIRDYFVPNNKNVIFRYSVKVLDDHLASLQVTTSKSDVYVKLQVLDNEEEIASATGKGHVVIPSSIFCKDINLEEDKRSSSRASERGRAGASTSSQGVSPGRKKRSDSAKSEGRASVSSHLSEVLLEGLEEGQEIKPHKYIIQATVLRNSWPLSESSWAFVQQLQQLEKDELKLNNPLKERPISAPKQEKAAPTPKGKGGKGKEKGKERDKKNSVQEGSRPASQQFDTFRPYWILRFVSDATAAEDVDVKKDTERADEIRAMKKAWEDAEPGRAAKALQSRLQYLNSHLIKLQTDEEEPAEKVDEERPSESGENLDVLPAQTPVSPLPADPEAEAILLHEPPPPPPPKEMLQPVDSTPFEKSLYGETRYKDEFEVQRQLEAQQHEIQEYRLFRQGVEEWRENDRKLRNLLKIQQLEMCEELQAELDKKRHEINTPREAFRQKYLEAERLKMEEIAAQEAALKAEQEKNAPTPKRGKSAKGKKSPAGGKKKGK
ncbi:androglobin-like isoform X5 [Lineus longissimus]|uniref:androglobin-like isoform X5 n=1 Tax=Lineus longissimus TaxID=88925 RepID=UPI00315C97EA